MIVMNNKNPKISVIIPVYNGSDYLSEAIDSVLAQTYENFEVVVVNDGSCDAGRTEAVALSYGDRIRYYSKDNGGVATALNLAVDNATGDYISWLSHDDLYVPNKLSLQVEALCDLGRDDVVLYSDYSVFTTDSAVSSLVRMAGVAPANFRFWITVENCLHGCTLLIPKKAFSSVGGFDPELKTTQDYDLWFRMASVFDFVHQPIETVKARSHPDQGSLRMSEIARVECDNLLTGFVNGLSLEEILLATGGHAFEGYRSVAESMFSRGFTAAGARAQALAELHAGFAVDNSHLRLRLSGKKALSKGKSFARALARKTLPVRARQYVRALLPTSFYAENVESLQDKFTYIYENNVFGGHVSRSGEGSDLVQTMEIRRVLPFLLKEYGVNSFLDAPCGDWCWMREVELGVKEYIGVDIVEPLIKSNLKNFAAPGVHFECLNLAEDNLPKVDLIFSRDCLVHLSFDDALRIIRNFKNSGSKYLLTTTFVSRESNNDLVGKDSFWRPLNMQLSPFNFPAPLQLINEQCSEEGGLFADKSLALWRLEDIQI